MRNRGSFQIISGVKYLGNSGEKGRHDLSVSIIRNVSVPRSSVKNNLSTDSLMLHFPAVGVTVGVTFS